MSSSTSKVAIGWTGVLLLLAVTGWFGWKALRDAKPENNRKGVGGRPPATVIVRPVEQRDGAQILKVTGTLRAVRRAEVAAQEPAAVQQLLVNEGDLVAKGNILAKLDSRRLEAQIKEGEAALTSARADQTQRDAELDRAIQDEEMMRGLWDERAVSEREYLDSLRERKVADARANAAGEMIEAAAKRLELLKVRLNDLEVRAPFSGRVVAHHTEIGEWVSPGSPIATLVSSGEMEAWLQLPERHVRTMRETSPASVELQLAGTMAAVRTDQLIVVPEVDGRSRRFTVVAHIPDPENQLTSGQSVEASVPLGKQEPHIVVMTDAVLSGYSGTYVFVVQENQGSPPTARRVPVQVRFQRGGDAYLSAQSELKPGELVIVEGNDRLFPNSPIDPRPWSETRGDVTKKTARAE